jgi:hypothetical protein
MANPAEPRGLLERQTTGSESVSETALAVLAILSFGLFPLVSTLLAEPWLSSSFGEAGFIPSPGNVALALLMVTMTIVLPAFLILVARGRTKRLSTAYMSGRPNVAGLAFKGSAGVQKALTMRAPYLQDLFPEARLLPAGIVLGIIILMIMFGTVLA